MNWKNAPIARVASIPGAMDLSLEEVALLGGLWKLTQKTPHKVFCWAYFDAAFGLSVSKARTRLARLEKAGLLVRQMVGERRSDAVGSQIQLTEMGKDLLRVLAPLLAQPEVSARPSALSPVSLPPATTQSELVPGRLADYPAMFQQAILKMGIDVARLVRGAIEAGQLLSAEQGRGAGLDVPQTSALNDALLKHGPARQSLKVEKAIGSSESRREEMLGTRVEAAPTSSIQEARAAGVPMPELAVGEGDGAAPIASMVAAEAASRYRKALCGRSPDMVAERLNEIVWSCTEGPLSDFGAPVKRVRVALSLLQAGRWETPKGYDAVRAVRAFKPALSELRSQ